MQTLLRGGKVTMNKKVLSAVRSVHSLSNLYLIYLV